MRKAVVLLAIGAAFAPASAASAVEVLHRQLDKNTAESITQKSETKDIQAQPNPTQWSSLIPVCSRQSRTWFKCRYGFYEIVGGHVTGRECRRKLDIRLRAGRPNPVTTKQRLICKS
jgi:hypothetical protein